MTKTNTADIAYQYIYDAIVTGRYAPGAPISESMIAKELNMSRSPIREVLNRMLVEGFVERYPGRGTFVSSMSKQDIEEILDLREMFELNAIKRSYRYISDDELNIMEEGFLNLNTDTSSPEVQLEYYRHDRNLHNTVVGYCGNNRLINYYKLNEAQMKRIQRISSKDPLHFSTSVMQHLQIVRVLRERDPDRAAFYLKEHLDSVKKRTLEMYAFYENAPRFVE